MKVERNYRSARSSLRSVLWVVVLSACGQPLVGAGGGNNSTPDAGSACAVNATLCQEQCVDLLSDPHNCGHCGTDCGMGKVCIQGTCHLDCTMVGGTDCGGSCVELWTDAMNCGACGHACGTGEDCIGAICRPMCMGGQTRCDSDCVDTSSDSGNCGHCGNACAPGATCSSGTCSPM